MKIEKCYFNNFKNLNNCILNPNSGINIIYGKNAQGKTNFLEAINLFSGKTLNKQFTKNLINFKNSTAQLRIDFQINKNKQNAKITLQKIKNNEFKFNNVPYKSLNKFYGKFFSVFFSPNSLLIINNSPNLRRKFLNFAISQLQPNYLKFHTQYEHILNQRNKILKNKNFYDENLLIIFSEQLAKLGTIISIYRFDYIKKISKVVSNIYYTISNNNEKLNIQYKSTIFNQPINEIYNDNYFKHYYNKLKNSFTLDKKYGFTSLGVHKDDIIFQIDSLNLKNYGSQGQKKSAIIALKLAQANLIFLITKIRPVILLDEVLSELDEFRQNFLLDSLNSNQIFISCCNLTSNLKISKKQMFTMQNGNFN